MLHIISLRAQISQNLKYWYDICDILVPIFTRCEELIPIFHSVKCAKCEICGSRVLTATIFLLTFPSILSAMSTPREPVRLSLIDNNFCHKISMVDLTDIKNIYISL